MNESELIVTVTQCHHMESAVRACVSVRAYVYMYVCVCWRQLDLVNWHRYNLSEIVNMYVNCESVIRNVKTVTHPIRIRSCSYCSQVFTCDHFISPYCHAQCLAKRSIRLIMNCGSDNITTQVPRFPRSLKVSSASTNPLVNWCQSTCIHAFVFPFIRILTSKHTHTQTTTNTNSITLTIVVTNYSIIYRALIHTLIYKSVEQTTGHWLTIFGTTQQHSRIQRQITQLLQTSLIHH